MALGVADPRMNRWFLFVVRLVVATTWFYQGLWLKVVLADPQQLAVVRSVGGPFTPLFFLRLIGIGETLIGVAVLAALWPRSIAAVQVALVVAMNTLGILFGGGAIERPIGLIVRNLPFLVCVMLLGIYRPDVASTRIIRA